MASHCTVPFWSRRGHKQDVKQRLTKQKAAAARFRTTDIAMEFQCFYGGDPSPLDLPSCCLGGGAASRRPGLT